MQLTTIPRRQLQTATAFSAAWQHPVESVGIIAERELSRDQSCQILAVFDRCFYVKTATGLLCVGLAELGRGPLNALLGSELHCLPHNLLAGDPVRISNHQIILDNYRIFDASQARSYLGKESQEPVIPQILQRNRNTLRSLKGRPQDGFFWLLENDKSTEHQSALQAALRQTTSASIQCLGDWLQAHFENSNAEFDSDALHASLGLLGAGPGLTPSGDDVLAGAMLALQRFQRSDAVKDLWEILEPSLTVSTNPISAAHLEQAAKGRCGEVMDDLLNTIFQSQDVDGSTLVAALDSMGCTSGWDTLGGAVMVIDAWYYSLKTTNRIVTPC